MPIAVDEFDLDIRVETAGLHQDQFGPTAIYPLASQNRCFTDDCSDYCPPTSGRPGC